MKHPEGVDLMPANIELSGTEVALVTAMNRERTLKAWLDEAKRGYDYALIDCMPSLACSPSTRWPPPIPSSCPCRRSIFPRRA